MRQLDQPANQSTCLIQYGNELVLFLRDTCVCNLQTVFAIEQNFNPVQLPPDELIPGPLVHRN